jgi:hypothetical protein
VKLVVEHVVNVTKDTNASDWNEVTRATRDLRKIDAETIPKVIRQKMNMRGRQRCSRAGTL